MHWRRTIGIGVAVTAVVAALVVGYRPMPVQVDAAVVKHGPLRVSIEEEGKTRVIDRYMVSAPVAGYVRRIDLKVGDTIRQGQPLAVLEPTPSTVLDPRSRAEAQARVDAASAALKSAEKQAAAAKAEAEMAQLEYERIIKLCKVQCTSKEEEDLAKTRALSSKAQQQSAAFNVDVARHQLEGAKTALAYAGAKTSNEVLTVTSPIDGSVLKVIHESEGVIGPGEALVEVGNPRHLEVEVDVLSADAVRITPGSRVLFERWGGDMPLEGRVRTIEPVGFTKVSALGVEEQRVLVISDLTSPADTWERLGDGYRVEAVFILWEEPDVLKVPSSALFRDDGGWAVFAIEGGRARQTTVTVGQRNGLTAQILSGLTPGQQVITHPSEAVIEGVKVAVR